MRVLGSYPLDEMASMAGSLDNSAMQTLKRQLMGSRPNASTPAPKTEPAAAAAAGEAVAVPAVPAVPVSADKASLASLGLTVQHQGTSGSSSEVRPAQGACLW